MKTFLKYFGLILLVLILIYAALCFLGPKNFNTDESISIDAPAPVVFNLVNSLQKAELWNDWSLNDTAMVTTYNNIVQGVGAESNFESPTQGKGSQKIIESIKNEKVSTQLAFDGWDGVNIADFLLTSSGDKTDLRWTFESGSELPFIMRGAFMVMGLKGSMKDSYRAGLENIKRIAEERAQKSLYNGYTINIVELGERNYLIKRGQVPMSSAEKFYSNSLTSLFSILQQSGVEMDGRPCGLYYKWDFESSTADMAAAIPLAEALSIDGASSLRIPEGQVIQVDHYGDSASSADAHYAIDDYMKDNGLFQELPMVEEYITDASTEEDPAKWLTRISYYYSE
jgi:effector-binding domain-containing protein